MNKEVKSQISPSTSSILPLSYLKPRPHPRMTIIRPLKAPTNPRRPFFCPPSLYSPARPSGVSSAENKSDSLFIDPKKERKKMQCVCVRTVWCHSACCLTILGGEHLVRSLSSEAPVVGSAVRNKSASLDSPGVAQPHCFPSLTLNVMLKYAWPR